MAAKRTKNMKSRTIKIETQGGWGILFRGPNAICGREQRGGVGVARMGPQGEQAGEVMPREQVRILHAQLGKWIDHWDNQITTLPPKPHKKAGK